MSADRCTCHADISYMDVSEGLQACPCGYWVRFLRPDGSVYAVASAPALKLGFGAVPEEVEALHAETTS